MKNKRAIFWLKALWLHPQIQHWPWKLEPHFISTHQFPQRRCYCRSKGYSLALASSAEIVSYRMATPVDSPSYQRTWWDWWWPERARISAVWSSKGSEVIHDVKFPNNNVYISVTVTINSAFLPLHLESRELEFTIEEVLIIRASSKFLRIVKADWHLLGKVDRLHV